MLRGLAGALLFLAQAIAAVRVITRMARTSGGSAIALAPAEAPSAERISVIVPVLNEAGRLAPCLEGLIAQSPAVAEILVVDGGSRDATEEVVREFAARDPRIRWIAAGPAPEGTNGKVHNLAAGADAADPGSRWLLTIDADVRPSPDLASSLLAHAAREHVSAFSVATRQRLSDDLDALIHPAMLTTLVYRFGIPGRATTRIREVQANGQCFLLTREALAAAGGFRAFATEICEDVTLARALADKGIPVGFYEAGDLVDVAMYSGGRETWANWSRSLPLRDRFADRAAAIALAEATLTQALPLAVLALRPRGLLKAVNLVLLMTRLGVLAGTRRAYADPPPAYWLSPLCDLPVIVRVWLMLARREHRWRGRTIVRGGKA